MKNFTIKLVVLIIAVAAFITFMAFRADGTSDEFYIRFTTPKQEALILGTSRAAQGILPQVLDSALQTAYPKLNIFDFAFTIAHSPYGPVYYNAIQQKLKTTATKGLYILAVDPWSVSAKQENPNDTSLFREKGMCLGTTREFNHPVPNIDYLLHSYQGSWGDILVNKYTHKSSYLHKNGWLEVTVSMKKQSIDDRTTEKILDYRVNSLPYYKFSAVRMAYLQKIIDLLKQHGDVYLVRIPVATEIYHLENSLIPNFDAIMQGVSKQNNIPYFNSMNHRDEYQYVDGNHLYKTSGKVYSTQLSDSIKNYKNKQNNTMSLLTAR